MAMREKKMCRHCLGILYETHVLSRPGSGVGVGLSSLYREGLSRRDSTGLKRIDSGNKEVLTWRQVAAVVLALSKGCHVFPVDRQDKGDYRSQNLRPGQ